MGTGGETQGKVRVAIQLVPVLPGSKVGRGRGTEAQELENTYFPPSTGNLVTLYQVRVGVGWKVSRMPTHRRCQSSRGWWGLGATSTGQPNHPPPLDLQGPAFHYLYGFYGLPRCNCCRPPRCWRDLYSAIDAAERLVYVTGWSVCTSTRCSSSSSLVCTSPRLVREEVGSQGETVGELLRRKAAEGVTVLIMTWNDKSNDGVREEAL